VEIIKLFEYDANHIWFTKMILQLRKDHGGEPADFPKYLTNIGIITEQGVAFVPEELALLAKIQYTR
jgi:hypothetical protein